MLDWQRHHGFVPRQAFPLQGIGSGRVSQADEPQIDLAGFEGAKLLSGGHVEKVERNVGVILAEGGQGFWEQVKVEVGQITNVQLSCFATAQAPHRLNTFGGQREQALGIDQEGTAFLSERDVLFGTVQQPHADFFLEILYLPCQRRLRQVKRRRGFGEVQRVRHGDEIPQMTEFHTLSVWGFGRRPATSIDAFKLFIMERPLAGGCIEQSGAVICMAR
jgi:hypothetical protein